ncbi:MAG: hypothetical protein ACI4IX_04120, partial [Acutalibacteraceae bacterium]
MKKSKQITLGILISLGVWIIGILSCGSIYLGDELDFWEGLPALSLIYPLIISAYAIASAFVSKKKDLPHFFKASQAVLLIPFISYLIVFIAYYFNEMFFNPLMPIVFCIFMYPAIPLTSTVIGSLDLFYSEPLMYVEFAIMTISVIAA